MGLSDNLIAKYSIIGINSLVCWMAIWKSISQAGFCRSLSRICVHSTAFFCLVTVTDFSGESGKGFNSRPIIFDAKQPNIWYVHDKNFLQPNLKSFVSWRRSSLGAGKTRWSLSRKRCMVATKSASAFRRKRQLSVRNRIISAVPQTSSTLSTPNVQDASSVKYASLMLILKVQERVLRVCKCSWRLATDV